jgi:hypothetical protein
MNFAVSQGPIDASSGALAPSANRRVSASATLVAIVMCAVVAKWHFAETQASSAAPAVAQNSVAAPVKVVAPEFCKDQTWPYIDSRCLRRVDNPAPPAAEPRVVAPAARPNTAATTPPPAPATRNADTAPPATTASTADNSPTAAPATSATDTQRQVIQSVFPTPASGTAESGPQNSTANGAVNTVDARPRHHGRGYRSSFFGFRF